ncbi:MAG: hypothetical protein ACTTH7_09565 [Treponema sp.]
MYLAGDDWEDENQTTGEKRKHKGGLVGKSGPFNLDGWSGDDLKIDVIYGKKKETVDELYLFFGFEFIGRYIMM